MLTEAMSEENRGHGLRIFAVSPGDTDTPMNPGAAKNKRKPQQVVNTAWRALTTTAPSVVDGRANSILATLSSRFFPKRLTLRIAEQMMRKARGRPASVTLVDPATCLAARVTSRAIPHLPVQVAE